MDKMNFFTECCIKILTFLFYFNLIYFLFFGRPILYSTVYHFCNHVCVWHCANKERYNNVYIILSSFKFTADSLLWISCRRCSVERIWTTTAEYYSMSLSLRWNGELEHTGSSYATNHFRFWKLYISTIPSQALNALIKSYSIFHLVCFWKFTIEAVTICSGKSIGKGSNSKDCWDKPACLLTRLSHLIFYWSEHCS